ncbi:protein kinase [Novymonas esmeraldas]|uniref:Protein kinase n=1 Tax=Novymonas esmeraldas TaxID=1808958 RepID=A0AAW0EZK3_9TRYP
MRHTRAAEQRAGVPPPVEGDVDSLYDAGAGSDIPRRESTVCTTLLYMCVPWLCCSLALVAVIVYINVHVFAVWMEVVTSDGAVADAVLYQRDVARYTVLGVSVALLMVHLSLSFSLFRRAYHVLWDVQMSLVELAFMVDMVRTYQHSTFFFVDCAAQAQRVQGSMRYWVKEFSGFAEISAAEVAINQVALRLMSASTEQAAAAAAREESAWDARSPHTGSAALFLLPPTRSGRVPNDAGSGRASLSPQDAAWSQPGATATARGDSSHCDFGAVRQLAGHHSGSRRSLSATTELGAAPAPFLVTLKRRHVALLLLVFLNYRVPQRCVTEEARRTSRDFIAAVNMLAQQHKACIVELYSDRAILSWNAFLESPGNYAESCVQCGMCFYDRFVRHLPPESDAFFSAAGYTGHVVCGTTTEKSLLLHGQPVAVLRHLPTLLEERYGAFVWLGAPPPASPGAAPAPTWSQIGEVCAGADVSYDLHAVQQSTTGPLPPPMRWHVPQWTTFGAEQTVGAASPIQHALVAAAAAPPPPLHRADAATLPSTEGHAFMPVDAPAPSPTTSAAAAVMSLPRPCVLSPYETFFDRSGIRYQLSDKLLGDSKSCVVRLGISETGSLVAVKEIKIERGVVNPMRRRRHQRENRIIVAKGEKPQWMSEVTIMERHRHTCIVAYISFVETVDKLRIVMEYLSGGNLLSFAAAQREAAGCGPPMAGLLRNVLEGLKFLHQRGIVHGDIKPQNVLVPDSGPCKIADFGISRRATTTLTSATAGTPFYMAPEATRGAVTAASDIWSFGIMMAQVLTGRLPYDPTVREYYLVSQFMAGKDVERHLSAPLEPAAMDVFLACTTYDAAARATAKSLLRMPYFTAHAAPRAGDS